MWGFTLLSVTSVHSPDPCLPAPAALSLSKAWTGQTPSDPPHRVPRLAPLPLWGPRLHRDDETAPDASLHHSGLVAVGLLFAFEQVNPWRCENSKEEVSSVKVRWGGEEGERAADEKKVQFLEFFNFHLFLPYWGNPSDREAIKMNCLQTETSACICDQAIDYFVTCCNGNAL